MVADGGVEDARAIARWYRVEPQERRSAVQRGSGHEVRALKRSSIREGRRSETPQGAMNERPRRRPRGHVEPASGANPKDDDKVAEDASEDQRARGAKVRGEELT